jgi:hypothetical protein
MRVLMIGAAVLSLAISGNAFAAGSKCDAAITKAAGKKVACKAGVVAGAQAKGGTPDPLKLSKCEAKFDKACQKAKTGGGCVAQTQSCAAIEAEADSCVGTISSSPSGAFLE